MSDVASTVPSRRDHNGCRQFPLQRSRSRKEEGREPADIRLRKRSRVLKSPSDPSARDGRTLLRVHKLIITAHERPFTYESSKKKKKKKSSTDELHAVILR